MCYECAVVHQGAYRRLPRVCFAESWLVREKTVVGCSYAQHLLRPHRCWAENIKAAYIAGATVEIASV